jgi:cell division protein FtsQ
MWFNEGPMVVRRRRPNRRRRRDTQTLLSVAARAADQRKERHHRLRAITLTLVAVAGVLWLLGKGVALASRVLFAANEQYVIRHFDFVSDGQLTPAKIREFAHLEEGMNLFDVDLGDVRRELHEVAVVKTVAVTRQLPDTLRIRIKERVALARLGADDRRHLLAIDRDGHVLGPTSRTKGLPAITGLRDRGLLPGSYIDEKLVRDALDVLDILDTGPLGGVIQVSLIDVRHPEYLDIRLRGGERFLFARRRMEWRLKQMASSLQEAALRGMRIVMMDLTVDKNPPVEWVRAS